MEVVTVPRVPILRTGHFVAESGEHDFSIEHLTSAANALANDPAVVPLRVRLELDGQGHLDDAGIDAEAAGGSGGPAIGWGDGYTVDGNTLYADLHLPAIVAESMEWAFPGRSIEGLFGWHSPAGNVHDFVATGLLLCGTSWPAVTTLPDFAEVQAEFAAEVESVGLASGTFAAPAPAAEPMLEASIVAATMPATGRAPRGTRDQLTAASLNVNDLRLRWYGAESDGELEGLPESYDFWSWYVLEVRAEDDGSLFVLCIDEADGRLWRFDVAAIDGPNVSFSEPTEVVLEVLPVAARGAEDATPRRPRIALARWGSRVESRPVAAAGGAERSPQSTEDDRPMTDAERRALALSLGLAEDTSEADLHAEAARRAEAPPAPDPEPGPDPEPDPEPTPDPEPAGVTARTRTVSADVLDSLEQRAARGDAAAARQEHGDRDRLVLAALDDGRITPAESGLGDQDPATGLYAIAESGWRRDLEDAPVVTARALARLEAGKYPGATARRGVAAQADSRPGSLSRALRSAGLNRSTEGVS